MPENKPNENTPHELHLRNRRELNLNGITEVVSFDDTSVLLRTVCGELTIDGTDLRISTLDTARGAVAVSGNIQAITYYDRPADNRRGKLGKLFG